MRAAVENISAARPRPPSPNARPWPRPGPIRRRGLPLALPPHRTMRPRRCHSMQLRRIVRGFAKPLDWETGLGGSNPPLSARHVSGSRSYPATDLPRILSVIVANRQAILRPHLSIFADRLASRSRICGRDRTGPDHSPGMRARQGRNARRDARIAGRIGSGRGGTRRRPIRMGRRGLPPRIGLARFPRWCTNIDRGDAPGPDPAGRPEFGMGRPCASPPVATRRAR